MGTIDKEVEAERLRHVRALIEDMLREHDICAQVILAGRAGRFENFTHLVANWSKLRIIQGPQGEGVGIRSRLADYGGDVQRQKQELEWSVGVASGFGEIGGRIAMMWIDAAAQLDALTGAEHTPQHRDDARDEP